jgi:SGNH hydrolase-like domain, acetyltransferase AlgX
LCGERRFVVCLIPDEFQVEDRLWETLQARVRDMSLERDRGQQLLKRELGMLGVEVVDLLPAFRAEAVSADGRRRLYHLQDTHWNARGNELAGRVLAEALGR